MLIAVLAAAAAISATCDLERPSGQPGCQRAAVDALPMNAIQVIGTHNSYKMAIAPNEMAMIHAVNAREADAIDYSHRPLKEQLEAGARQLEIDVVYDPDVGLYASPMGYRQAGGKAMNQIDAEIRSVFPENALITPDQVQGKKPTLREAVAAGDWPTLGEARGRVMIALDCPPDQVARYREDRKTLEGRVAFVNTDETSPAAGYITLNEPQKEAARIAAAVKAGLIVRTRADADTWEARKNDRSRQVAAFASGAQYVSTDYMEPDVRFGPYAAALPGGGAARLSPVQPAK